MAEPLPVIPLEYAAAKTRKRRGAAFFAACAAFGWLGCVAAWFLIAFVDVKSVLVAGPIIALAGLVALVGGLLAEAHWVTTAGGGHCALCALFFGLVNVLHWGPANSRGPFLWMGALYCLASLPVTIVAARRAWCPVS